MASLANISAALSPSAVRVSSKRLRAAWTIL